MNFAIAYYIITKERRVYMLKKYIVLMLLIIFIINGLGLLISCEKSEQDENSNDELDNFEVNEISENWDFMGGEWIMNENQISINSTETEAALTTGTVPANFTYQAEVYIGKRGEAGLLFRTTQNEDNSLNGYYFAANTTTQKVLFYRIFKGEKTLVADKKLTLEPETWYEVRIDVYRNRIYCYWLNNKNDSDPYPQFDLVDDRYWEGVTGIQGINEASFRGFSVDEYTPPKSAKTYRNPLKENSADPFVLLHDGMYYLYATSSDSGFQVFSSPDMSSWKDEGWALRKEDSWGDRWFWAPEIIVKDGIFYMYYSVEEHLCVATSDSPLGPFKQEVKSPIHPNIKEIDGHVFLDDDGKYYIYFVRFDNGNNIWGAELNDDMASIKRDTLIRLLIPTEDWEKAMYPVVEGPFILKHERMYYLTYSGDHFESPGYGVGYAISDNPLGPFVKHKNNPIMQSNTLVHGAGHHSFVRSPDGTELFMVYHIHNNTTAVQPRRTCIDRAKFVPVNGGPDELLVYGPTLTPQPVPSGSVSQ